MVNPQAFWILTATSEAGNKIGDYLYDGKFLLRRGERIQQLDGFSADTIPPGRRNQVIERSSPEYPLREEFGVFQYNGAISLTSSLVLLKSNPCGSELE